MQEWLGWFVPARTPADTVARLNTLVREGLQAPDFVAALAQSGLAPLHQPADEFARMLRADLARWAPVVKASGFTAED